MGIVLWLAAGLVALLVARIIPPLRPVQRTAEAAAALGGAFAAGVASTALDFGGWNEPDARSGFFALFTGLTIVALVRWTRAWRIRRRA
jgi:hypothetical protein